MLCSASAIDGELELEWLDRALDGHSTAALWTGRPGLVAPLSYRRHAGLEDVCAASAARGWPVRLRRSGGGVVPQGPGILNVSLAYPCTGSPGKMMQTVYAQLCAILTEALAGLGIAAEVRSVEGSFCDGRFNLAVAGIVDADPAMLTSAANRFEAALGSGRQYDTKSLTSAAQAWSAAHPGECPSANFSEEVRQRIAAALRH